MRIQPTQKAARLISDDISSSLFLLDSDACKMHICAYENDIKHR